MKNYVSNYLSLLHFINGDRYQYTESEVLFSLKRRKDSAIFEYFFRRSEDGGYAIVSGTHDIVQLLHLLNHASEQDKYNYFSTIIQEESLLKYLCQLQFTGNIYAMREGEIAYPGQPIIIVEGELIPTKLLETPLLNTMNYQMTIASKSNRILRAMTGHNVTICALGSRRAHGLDSSIFGTKAALIGGCHNHSSLAAEYLFKIPAIGTMSHSYIQSFGIGKNAEYQAFDAFTKYRKQKIDSIILLIDTYDSIKSGLENAIKCFKNNCIDDQYSTIYGIRIDSGDLAYLSKYCRKRLITEGFHKAHIVLTNALDEYLIEDLFSQQASMNSVGIGEAIAVNKDNPCFSGVYKLVVINNQPVMKISENLSKTSTPGFKEVYRIYQDNQAIADLICLRNDDRDQDLLLQHEKITLFAEHNNLLQTTLEKNSYTFRKLLVPMMINGELTEEVSPTSQDIEKAQQRRNNNMAEMSEEHLRLINSHLYKVDISTDLQKLKKQLIINVRNSL